MTRLNKILIGLIAVQLVLAVVLRMGADPARIAAMQPVLAGFDSAQVTRIQVFDKNADKAAIDLVKAGEAWKLASAFDHPVDAIKVSDLLGKLAGMKSRGPIATTPVRHQQLGVADKSFEKKLIITTAKGDTTLLVGNQSEGRTTAVRIGGTNQVFGVTGVSPWAIDIEPARWIATDYLTLDKELISRVEIQGSAGTTTLERAATGWQLDDATGQPVVLAAGETLDPAAIDKVVDHVAAIKLVKPGDPKHDASAPTATVSVWLTAADPTAPGGPSESIERPADHVIDVILDGDNYWVHERSLATAGIVGKGALSDVVEVSRDKLVKQAAAPAPKPAAPKPGAPKPGAAKPGAPKPAPP